MNNLPGGLVLIFIALSFFYYVSQKTKIRREEKRERLKEAREEFLRNVLAKRHAEPPPNDEGSDTTKAG